MITVTDSAAAKVKELLEQEDEDDLALRVAVRPGGCSGFSYEMFFDSDVSDDDTKATFGQVEVIVAEPDRNRINAAFVAAVQSELASKGRGSKLELAGDTLQLTGGFILRASGLEIDCSLDAILAASQDELAPLVAEALLGR